MRLTRKKYEAAKIAVEALRGHQQTIRDWEAAIKRLGDFGDQRVVTITIKDGKVTAECEPTGNRTATGQPSTTKQAATENSARAE